MIDVVLSDRETKGDNRTTKSNKQQKPAVAGFCRWEVVGAKAVWELRRCHDRVDR